MSTVVTFVPFNPYLEVSYMVLGWMMEYPKSNIIELPVDKRMEFSFQEHYNNNDSVGRNLRRLLREGLRHRSFPIYINGFTSLENAVRIDYRVFPE